MAVSTRICLILVFDTTDHIPVDITSEELYPDFKYVKFEEYVNDLVAGKIDEFYVEMKEQLKAMLPMKP